jgi:hypothetical protein
MRASKRHSATVRALVTDKQAPHGVPPELSARRTMHGAGWWRNNPLTNVQYILYRDPVNGLPITLMHTNPTLKLIVAFTEVPKRLNVFEALCKHADILILPEGVFIPSTLLHQTKRVLRFQTREHLASLCLNLCRQEGWAPKDLIPPLIKVFQAANLNTLLPSQKLAETPEQEGLIHIAKSAIERPGFRDCHTFEAMITFIEPHIQALYLKEDIYNNYQTFLEQKTIGPILLRLMREGLRLDTCYSEEVALSPASSSAH